MDIQKQIEECETTEHELYVSVGLNSPVEPSVFKECIDNFLSDNIRVKSWGVHTKDEYIGIIDEQQSIISQQTAEIGRLTRRVVPDMTELSHNDHFQLKALHSEFGSGYLIAAIRHLDHLAGLPDIFSPERTSPTTIQGVDNT